MQRPAALVWITSGLLYFTLEAAVAHAYPGYRYLHNTISDLGVPVTSPLAPLMNLNFVIHGALFLLGATLVPRHRTFLTFVAINTVGNLLISAIPSSSEHADLHLLGAALAIVAGNLALISSPYYRRLSISLGTIGLLSLLILVSTNLPKGVFERVSADTIMFWEILVGCLLLRNQTGGNP